MSARRSRYAITERVGEHPAALAARELGFAGEPTSLEVLKEHRKTMVCRLYGVGGHADASIIAKRVKRGGARVERRIYEEVLPRLALDALTYFGSVDGDEGNTVWMFLEDAGETGFDYASRDHRVLLVEWLGRLHTAALAQDVRAHLEDRGPEHFLRQLDRAVRMICDNLGNPSFRADDVRLLGEIAAELQTVRSWWETVERFDGLVPRSFVHGDMVPKNLRVRAHRNGLKLAIMDWEEAGWGSPCVDLASFFTKIPGPESERYLKLLRERQPAADPSLVERMGAFGFLLRRISAIYWESHSLVYERDEGVLKRMRTYREGLRSVLPAIRAMHV